MKNWLVFPDEPSAQQALDVIATSMNLPVWPVNAASGQVEYTATPTTAWAVAMQRLDGAWVFPAPPAEHLVGIEGYQVEAYQESWFDAGDEP
jgi:hypothetical protein